VSKRAASATESAHHAAVLWIILISYVMIILDTSIVITGLPKIQAELGFSATHLSWIQNAHTLAFGGLLLLAARAGDIVGRRRMFLTGLAIFTVASVGVGISQSIALMLVGRALQGVGAAILAPSTLALLQSNFAEGPQRTRAVAYYGAAAGIGASVGLVLGGILADWLSWRVGFFINLPIGIVLGLGTLRFVRETARHTGRFDLAGAITSTAGMFALVFGIVHSADAGWSDPVTLAQLAAAAVLLVLFVFTEARAKQPIMPLRLFANAERAGAYAARLLFLGGMVGFFFFTTQFMQGVLGFNPFQAGIGFLPMTLVNFGIALQVPRLTRRFGNGPLLAFGLALTCVGLAWLSRVGVGASYVTGVALPMVLIGIGQGCALSPLTVAGVAGVAEGDAGAASGVVNVAHQLGLSLGLSISVVAFASAGHAALGGARVALAHGVSAALTAGAAMMALAFITALATSRSGGAMSHRVETPAASEQAPQAEGATNAVGLGMGL
jgi:EmrB/QacA subfamily drug resistance transporter